MGECIDRSGNIYITDYQKKTIEEYAHGGSTAIHVIKRSTSRTGAQSIQKPGILRWQTTGKPMESTGPTTR